MELWYFLISRSAAVPGRNRYALFFFLFAGSGSGSGDTWRSGGSGLQRGERPKRGRGSSLGILATGCFVRVIAAAGGAEQLLIAAGERAGWEEQWSVAV